jgi:LDH2 family malate/lactate/ureidoglycolate dehydrogenase
MHGRFLTERPGRPQKPGMSFIDLRHARQRVARMQIEKPVLVPGDPERQTLAERRSEGVPIDDETWREILATGQSVGIEPDELRSLAAVN